MTDENREGGTIDGGRLPATGAAVSRGARDHAARRRRRRADARARRLRPDRARGVSQQRHDHRVRRSARTGSARARRSARFAVRGTAPTHTWVAGVAVERDAYDPLDVPRFALHVSRVPGVFVQDDVTSGAVAVRVGERAPRSPQRVRHVLQPAPVGAAAIRRLDQPRVGRTGILRADAADRGDRSGRAVAA